MSHLRLGLWLPLWLAAAPLLGQQPPDDEQQGEASGDFIHAGGGGVWGAEGEYVFALEFRSTKLKHGGLGFDFGVAIPPESLQFGALVLGSDVGAAFSYREGPSTTALRAGLAVLTLLGDGGNEVGGYIGATQFFLADTGGGIRIDLAHRRFAAVSGGLWSISAGLAWGLP